MFDTYQAMVVENCMADLQQYRERPLEVQEFMKLLVKYEEQLVTFKAMPVAGSIGIIKVLTARRCDAVRAGPEATTPQVESAKLKATLLPSPEECLKDMKELLPAVVQAKTQLLSKQLLDANDKISGEPNHLECQRCPSQRLATAIPGNVEQFVSIMAFLTNTRAYASA